MHSVCARAAHRGIGRKGAGANAYAVLWAERGAGRGAPPHPRAYLVVGPPSGLFPCDVV